LPRDELDNFRFQWGIGPYFSPRFELLDLDEELPLGEAFPLPLHELPPLYLPDEEFFHDLEVEDAVSS
jgi:hypothetical protein